MDGLTPREVGDEVIEALKQLAADLDVPQYLSDVNIPDSAIDQLADAAMGQTRLLVNNPRSLTRDDVVEIYRRCAVRPDED